MILRYEFVKSQNPLTPDALIGAGAKGALRLFAKLANRIISVFYLCVLFKSFELSAVKMAF